MSWMIHQHRLNVVFRVFHFCFMSPSVSTLRMVRTVSDKQKLYVITGGFDVMLLMLLVFNNMSSRDRGWVYGTLLIHLLFLYGLRKNHRKLLNGLHYFVCILPTLGLFLSSLALQVICLLFFILVQVLWISEKRCILNEKDDSFGFGNIINYYFLVLTTMLAIKLGYSYAKW